MTRRTWISLLPGFYSFISAGEPLLRPSNPGQRQVMKRVADGAVEIAWDAIRPGDTILITDWNVRRVMTMQFACTVVSPPNTDVTYHPVECDMISLDEFWKRPV